MKTNPLKLMLMAITLLALVFIASCSSDDDEPVEGDKTELIAAIDEVQDILDNAEEGTLEGQYQTGAKAELQEAIDKAQDVVDDKTAEQGEVNSALANLNTALETFQAKVVEPVDVANLVARWRFDEGTGTTATDATENNFDGTFKNGHANWGAGFPEWSTDRFGTAGKALHFDKGGNIEIPYNTALNPSKISISIWLKADEIRENNRFIGLQSWLGYKFQLQSTNRPYFSISTNEGIREEDAQQELPVDEWFHVVATFGDGKLTFYINGDGKITSFNMTGEGSSIANKPYNLVIGQDFPTDKYSLNDGTNFNVEGNADYHVIPLAWGGYFHGSLDEVRIYKSALTASQVMAIYNAEKP